MWPWDELGIEPTGDRKAVRRAYAARLKDLRPDEDPAAFARLRPAYERALADATSWEAMEPADPEQVAEPAGWESAGWEPGAWETDASAPADVRPVSPPPSGSEPPAALRTTPAAAEPEPLPTDLSGELEDARQHAAIAKISNLLHRRDVAGAADALVAARNRGDLLLSQDMALSDAILAALAYEDALPDGSLIHAASRLGWNGKNTDGVSQSPVLSRVQDRLAAEEWVVKLRRQGSGWRAWLGGHRAGAARLMLGRGWPLLSWLLPPEPYLSLFMNEYSFHEKWAQQRLDAQRIRLLRRMLAPPFPRIASVLWYVLMIGPFVVGIVLSGVSGLGGVAFLWVWLARRLRRFARSIVLMMVVLPVCLVLAVAAGALDSVETPAERLARMADGGDADAAYELAKMLEVGKAVPAGSAGIAARLRQALPRHPEAAASLAGYYEEGLGITQDTAEARRLYTEAASRGDRQGQAGLGYELLHGIGGRADPATGLDLLRQAARQGSGWAMFAVGQAYVEGLGVAREPAQAVPWLEAAANHVSSDAMLALGMLYLNGDGVPRSPQTAYVWLGRARRWMRPGTLSELEARSAQERAAQQVGDLNVAGLDGEIDTWVWDSRKAPEP